jgi:type II secretory pathway component PulJ
MSFALPSTVRFKRAAGMTLLEALLALLLLSACLVPAAEALHGAIGAPGASAQAAIELDCVSARMEAVLAEPYTRLLGAAGGADDSSSFSTLADGACPAIKVTIARYGVDRTRTLTPNGSSNYLLQVSAELADAGAGNRFTLNTLVTQ